MAYMNQQMKKVIAENMKPVLAKYGIKATLSVRNHSTIYLNVRAGAIDFGRDRFEVSEHWLESNYQGQALDFLKEAFAALKSAGWYDKSDVMTDYFHTAYYCYIHIGDWGKPYQVVPASKIS